MISDEASRVPVTLVISEVTYSVHHENMPKIVDVWMKDWKYITSFNYCFIDVLVAASNSLILVHLHFSHEPSFPQQQSSCFLPNSSHTSLHYQTVSMMDSMTAGKGCCLLAHLSLSNRSNIVFTACFAAPMWQSKSVDATLKGNTFKRQSIKTSNILTFLHVD